MSSSIWNFREILNVSPHSPSFTCVGTTKKETRCGNKRPFLAAADLSNGASLLDKMDNLSTLKASYQYLYELADLSLCKRWHRHAQTERVAMRWKSAIRKHGRGFKREKEHTAALRAKRQLADMREAAFKLKVELEKKNKENVPPAKILKSEAPIQGPFLGCPGLDSPSPIDLRSKFEDPFLENKVLKHAKPNLFGTTLFENGAFGKAAFSTPSALVSAAGASPFSFEAGPPSNCSIKPTLRVPLQNKTSSQNTKDAIEQGDSALPPRHISLPSPPDTPTKLSSDGAESEAVTPPATSPTKEQHQFTLTQTSTIIVTSKTNFAYEFGSQSSNPMDAFKFELPVETPEEQPSKTSLSNEDQVSHSASLRSWHSPRPKSFEFDIPRKSSLRQRIPRLITSMPVHDTVILEVKPPLEAVPHENKKYAEDTSTFLVQLVDQAQYQVSPAEPVIVISSTSSTGAESAPIKYSQDPSTPPQQHEESFGYAVVTPSSTRYSTYLPARQQYGLSTPPETPEKLPLHVTPRTIQRGEEFFSRLPSPLPFTIPRKPLSRRPSHSLKRRNEVRWKSSERPRLCHICRAPRYMDAGGCGCTIGKEQEEENVKSGCLDSLGWARLREKVLQRMKSKVARAVLSDTKVSATRVKEGH